MRGDRLYQCSLKQTWINLKDAIDIFGHHEFVMIGSVGFALCVTEMFQ